MERSAIPYQRCLCFGGVLLSCVARGLRHVSQNTCVQMLSKNRIFIDVRRKKSIMFVKPNPSGRDKNLFWNKIRRLQQNIMLWAVYHMLQFELLNCKHICSSIYNKQVNSTSSSNHLTGIWSILFNFINTSNRSDVPQAKWNWFWLPLYIPWSWTDI